MERSNHSTMTIPTLPLSSSQSLRLMITPLNASLVLPTASISQFRPTLIDECPDLTENFRQMNIPTSIGEKVTFPSQFGDPPESRYTDSSQYSLPPSQFKYATFSQRQRRPAQAESSFGPPWYPSTHEKTYRGSCTS